MTQPPSRTSSRSSRRQVNRRRWTSPPARTSPEMLLGLAHRLTERDHKILELVWEHRVFTTQQLTEVFFEAPRRARRRLLELHRMNALDRFQPWVPVGTSPCHWLLGPAGAQVLAARRGIEVAELGYRRTSTQALCHSRKLGHQVGVNQFFTHLHALARHRADGTAVTEWWPERRCAALWGDMTRPDAYGRWTEPRPVHRQHDDPAEVEFFLEHDTGSVALPKVVGKLTGYTNLAESTNIITPVLFWLPSTAREINLRKLLGNPEIPVATAVHTPTSDPEGPAGPVWLPSGSTGPRLRLIDLLNAWPDTGRTETQ